MTKTIDIDAMVAGRELDALVAEKVMGWIDIIIHLDFPMGFPEVGKFMTRRRVPNYSTQIEPAWEVLEKMNNLQPNGHAGPARLHNLSNCTGRRWDVQFCTDFGFIGSNANTAPLAICKVSLKAVMHG